MRLANRIRIVAQDFVIMANVSNTRVFLSVASLHENSSTILLECVIGINVPKDHLPFI